MALIAISQEASLFDAFQKMERVGCVCSGDCMSQFVHLSDYLPFIDDVDTNLMVIVFTKTARAVDDSKIVIYNEASDHHNPLLINPKYATVGRGQRGPFKRQFSCRLTQFERANPLHGLTKHVSAVQCNQSPHVPKSLSARGLKEKSEEEMNNQNHRSLPRHATANIQHIQHHNPNDAQVVWLGRYPTSFVTTASQPSYELSYELLRKNIEMLEKKYGGKERAHRSAIVIQRAYRRHTMQRTFNHVMDMNRRRQRLQTPSPYSNESHQTHTPSLLRLHRYAADNKRTPPSTNPVIDYSSISPLPNIRPPPVRVSVGRQRSISAGRNKTSRTALSQQQRKISQPPQILSHEGEVLTGHTVYADCAGYATYSESTVSSPCSDASYSACSSSSKGCVSPAKIAVPTLVDAGASAVYATRIMISEQHSSPKILVSPRSSISPIWVPRMNGTVSPRHMSPLATCRTPPQTLQSCAQASSSFGPSIDDSPLRRSEMQRKRQYRIALNFFNKKPDRGMQFLIDYNFVESNPLAVAKFLLSRRGLSKQMIGEYLGNLQNPFNGAVLDCFVNQVDLQQLELDVALRKFQGYFRLPGEAQKIERVIEVFSRRYWECNPEAARLLTSMDTVFVLAFAIIMLNTDLHSPSIKCERRMKLDDFVKNLRGVDNGQDINSLVLTNIYDRVKQHEFRFASDHVTQVLKVDRSIIGKKPTLSVPHRRLVCYCRLYEVMDSHKKQSPNAHQREIFLFNDLLVITKVLNKKKNGVTYSYRASHSLVGMQLQHFKNNNFPYGLRINLSLENKVLLLHARSEEDKVRFMEDLRESIMESDEMEAIRIELELEKQSHITRPLVAQSVTARSESQRDSGLPDLQQADNAQVMQRALSNPMLQVATGEIAQARERTPEERARTPEDVRRASVNSLDSGMSSTASVESRESSPKNAQVAPPTVNKVTSQV